MTPSLELVNGLLNDPAIRPFIAVGTHPLDGSALVSDPRNVVIADERGGAIFAWRGPGIYEGHSFFRVRGREALDLGKEIIGKLDFEMLWGATPLQLRAARWFNRQLGFESLGEIDTPEGRCELFRMRG